MNDVPGRRRRLRRRRGASLLPTENKDPAIASMQQMVNIERYLLPLTYLADKFGAEALALKCHEALKWTHHVTNIDKLLVAIKTSAPALENHVIESLTAEDIKELVETDVMKELGDECLAKILKKSASFI